MKNKVDGVIIVEGISDVAFLSSFLDALYFITDGYNLDDRKIDFIIEASKKNKIIIFTDNDDAGEKIRKKLHEAIQGGYDALIDKKSRKNYKKKGVAEGIKEDVLETLKDHLSDKDIFKEEYDLVNLISLSDNPKKKKEEIINRFHLYGGNNKALVNQLRILKISKEELWK